METRTLSWKDTIIANIYLFYYIPILFWVVGLLSDVMMRATYTEPAVEMITTLSYAYIVLRLVIGIGEPRFVYIVQTGEENPNNKEKE